MKSRKIITSSIIALTLLGSSAPILAGASTLQTYTNQVQNTDNLQVSQEFIDKFNDAVKLTDGRFTLNRSLLPEGTTNSEINKLEKLISENNITISKLDTFASDNVINTGDSIVVGETLQDAQYEANENKIIQVGRFHQGSNYFHVYWWGVRIGISKNTLRGIGTGTASLGWLVQGLKLVGKIPTPYTKAANIAAYALKGTGFALRNAPGGIVFNSTPLIANVWGVGFQ